MRPCPKCAGFEVHRELSRLVITFEDNAYTLAELLSVLDTVERSQGVAAAPFRDQLWEHPGDDETTERIAAGMLADAFGAAVGFGLRFSPLPASRIAGTVASVLAIVQTSPRLRRPLDERVGPNRANLGMSMGAAAAYGLAQRPGSAFVELVHKASQLSAERARRRVWEAREPVLFQQRRPSTGFRPVEPRPRPLPRGPIEEYADRAWVVSLGGFALSLLATRSVQRAVAALYGGLPKPARHGRDAFTSHLESQLAARGVLVLDRAALARLDRIDCLVLEGGLVARDRFEVRSVLCEADVDDRDARRLVRELFDAAKPIARHEGMGYVLEPLGSSSYVPSSELAVRAGELGSQGGLTLSLSRAGRVLALAEVEWIAQTGIEELIAAAHDAQMRVVIASNDDTVLHGFAADDTISDTEGMERGVRRLQREGRGVCVVASNSGPGLQAADFEHRLAPGRRGAALGRALGVPSRFVRRALLALRQHDGASGGEAKREHRARRGHAGRVGVGRWRAAAHGAARDRGRQHGVAGVDGQRCARRHRAVAARPAPPARSHAVARAGSARRAAQVGDFGRRAQQTRGHRAAALRGARAHGGRRASRGHQRRAVQSIGAAAGGGRGPVCGGRLDRRRAAWWAAWCCSTRWSAACSASARSAPFASWARLRRARRWCGARVRCSKSTRKTCRAATSCCCRPATWCRLIAASSRPRRSRSTRRA
ncbi:MAG: hypothetical protein QM756_21210 [Polyangiaceae bacterium]